VRKAIAAARSAADSASPSKETMGLGGDMGEGLEIGIKASTKGIVDQAAESSQAAIAAFSTGLSGFQTSNGSILGAIQSLASALQAGSGGGTTQVVLNNYGPISNEVDIESLAYRVAGVIQRKSRRG
jgi:hypothetical protein